METIKLNYAVLIGTRLNATIRSLMATVTTVNGGFLKVLLSICGVFFAIIVAMLGFWINQQAEALTRQQETLNHNGNRLTAIETSLRTLEADIRELHQ